MLLDSLKNFLGTTGIARLFDSDDWWKIAIMYLISFVLVYLAIVKKFEPLLLLPIAIGMLLTNLPGAGLFHLDFFIAEDISFGLREMDEKPPVLKESRDTREKRTDRPQKLKFSFKEQREYETIDQDIANLEARIADCEAAIILNASDYIRLQELMEEKTGLEAQLEEKTERWVYLYDLAERIAEQDANK